MPSETRAVTILSRPRRRALTFSTSPAITTSCTAERRDRDLARPRTRTGAAGARAGRGPCAGRACELALRPSGRRPAAVELRVEPLRLRPPAGRGPNPGLVQACKDRLSTECCHRARRQSARNTRTRSGRTQPASANQKKPTVPGPACAPITAPSDVSISICACGRMCAHHLLELGHALRRVGVRDADSQRRARPASPSRARRRTPGTPCGCRGRASPAAPRRPGSRGSASRSAAGPRTPSPCRCGRRARGTRACRR